MTLINQTLRQIIYSAHQTQDYRVIGGGLAGHRAVRRRCLVRRRRPLPERLQMVRALLADRFGLRMHAETREQPVYVLDVISRDGKVGSGLKPSSCMPGTAPQPSATQTCGNRSAPGVIASGGATPDSLANQLGRLPAVARPVVNRTCVARIFDCELTFYRRSCGQRDRHGLDLHGVSRATGPAPGGLKSTGRSAGD